MTPLFSYMSSCTLGVVRRVIRGVIRSAVCGVIRDGVWAGLGVCIGS